VLEDGTTHKFDRLLIATGGIPIIPDTPGKDKSGVFTLITWEDAKRIKAYLPGVNYVVVVGGGLIGMKTAEGLYESGKKVSIIELMPHILGRILDVAGAELVQRYLSQKGIELITNTTIEEIVGENHLESIRLRNGALLPCDMLIFAIGVKPNYAMIINNGILLNRGILVNNKMQTNFPDIYAAGDVAEGPDLLSTQKSVIAIWPIAFRQGGVAGTNMAGGNKLYDGGVVQNSIGILGLHTITIGLVDPPKSDDYTVLIHKGPSTFEYRKFIFYNDILIGAILIDKIDRAGIITGLIKEKTKFESSADKEKLLHADFGLISLPPKWRKEKLTQPV
jgi:NAD(P)H-nitrite reductase large subunit